MQRTSYISYLIRKSPLVRSLLWLAVALFFVIVCVILGVKSISAPVLTAIVPDVAKSGDTVVLTGRNFGSDKGTGFVDFSSILITKKAILDWTATSIRLIVPEGVQNGFVYVGKKNKKSDGIFFTNLESIPIPVPKPQPKEMESDQILDDFVEE